jgi:hypothetical protein
LPSQNIIKNQRIRAIKNQRHTAQAETSAFSQSLRPCRFIAPPKEAGDFSAIYVKAINETLKNAPKYLFTPFFNRIPYCISVNHGDSAYLDSNIAINMKISI